MKSRGIWSDEFTFAPLLKSCSNLLDVKMGQGVHKEVISVGFESFSSIRIGIVELNSFHCFQGHAPKNVVSWNAMISDLAFNGKGELGVDLLEEMLLKDMKLNDVTFVGVLACCAHAGLVP
ncbi:Pentatricopeptide repeat-containing protein [Camellia lanceoleosa]|uniref:Pentatricopeptide repeat-containing protein n=1 Tax=Camellia lanceoleosa TaxID=1840588 RepID=A0ACC0IJ22_9ERIC|nr:Pentatricopeptide repeat-containing protein [Camellia lanceoleosa]